MWMDVSNLFNQVLGVAADEGPRLKRSQLITRENDRKNLLTLHKHIIRAIIQEYAENGGTLNEGASQPLMDLLLLCEKVIFNGFRSSMKSNVMVLRTPDAELWTMLTRFGRASDRFIDVFATIDTKKSLLTHISKLRLLFRTALELKILPDLFEEIVNFSALREYYDPEAFLRCDCATEFCAILLGLRPIDCQTVGDFDVLQEQPLTIDFTPYVRLPTVAMENEKAAEVDPEDERRVMSRLREQNAYNFDRIKQLEANLAEANRKLARFDTTKQISIGSSGAVSFRASVDDESTALSNNLRETELEKELEELKLENEKYRVHVVELQDEITLYKGQVADKAKVCTDLYAKMRTAEECANQREEDYKRMRDSHKMEINTFTEKLEEASVARDAVEKAFEERKRCDSDMESNYSKKCQDLSTAIANLEKSQQSFADSEKKVASLEKELSSCKKTLEQLPILENENMELKVKLEIETNRANQNELTSKEMGESLSESRLKIIELTEELHCLPEAEWERDDAAHECRICNNRFSLTIRKHHCRNCGKIFCNRCSSGRVKLVSKNDPSRVCDLCFDVLKQRMNV